MATLRTLFFCLIIPINAYKISENLPCSTCPDTEGHINGCTLLQSGRHLLRSTQAVSVLQCFDKCLRESSCEFYAFDSKPMSDQELPCKLFSNLGTLQDSLVAKARSTFSWMKRDFYQKWLSPTCQENVCKAPSLQGLCDKPLDLAFLIDISVAPENSFIREKTFVSNVLKKFRLGPGHVMPAVITYCLESRMYLDFNNFTSTREFNSDLLSIPVSPNPGSRYDKALTIAVEKLFTSQGGARPFAQRVVVLIANNNLPTSESIDTRAIKVSVANRCARTFVVTVGKSYDHPEAFASIPLYLYARKVDFFTELNSTVEDTLASKICSDLA